MALYTLSTEPEDPTGWRSLLGPAPLIWVCVAATAGRLKHAEEWNPSTLTTRTEYWIALAITATALVGVLNLLSRVLASLVARCWLTHRLGPLSGVIVRRRVRHWKDADEAAASAANELELAFHSARRNRIALAEPRCITWMADRHASAEDRIKREYGLDIASAWPRLWLLLSAPEQRSLQAATEDWRNATRLAAWGILYLLLAMVWWPVVLVGAVVFFQALVDARSATARFTDLVEAVADIHVIELASALRVDLTAGSFQGAGVGVTAVSRKGG